MSDEDTVFDRVIVRVYADFLYYDVTKGEAVKKALEEMVEELSGIHLETDVVEATKVIAHAK